MVRRCVHVRRVNVSQEFNVFLFLSFHPFIYFYHMIKTHKQPNSEKVAILRAMIHEHILKKKKKRKLALVVCNKYIYFFIFR